MLIISFLTKKIFDYHQPFIGNVNQKYRKTWHSSIITSQNSDNWCIAILLIQL